jgi:nicotinate phosphoribosyltransferase
VPSQFSFGFPELLLSSRLVESRADETWCFELALADSAGMPFLIAAGLEPALELLEDLSLAATDLALLQAEPGPERIDESLDADALAKVGALRFHGDVEAVPEGTVLFAGQPLLRLRATAAEAAAVGQAVAGIIRAQSTVATAVARARLAAGGKPVWESCGPVVSRDEALLMARAAQVGGAAGTTQPIAAGALAAPALPLVPFTALVAMGGRLRGLKGCAVELDGAARRDPRVALAVLSEAPATLVVSAGFDGASKELLEALRLGLDARGFGTTRLFAAQCEGPERIAELTPRVDGFILSHALLEQRGRMQEALAFELVERRGGAVDRRDGGQGVRAVWRRREAGRFRGDTVQSDTVAPPPRCAPLLLPMMRAGKRQHRAPSLAEVRVLCESQLSMFEPEALATLGAYPVQFIGAAAPARPPSMGGGATTSGRPGSAAGGDLAPEIGERAAEQVAEPIEEPAAPRLIDQVDDSADFTLVSNAFASMVTRKLGLPAEPMVAPDSPGPAAAPEAGDAPTGDTTPEPEQAPVASASENPLLAAAARLRAMQRGEPLAPRAPVALASAHKPDAPVATTEPEAQPDDPLLAAAARLRRMRGG